MKNGNCWLLKDAIHVPQLRRNLITAGQLDSLGYSVTFEIGAWKVTKGELVIAKGCKYGTLYVLDG
jgi:hypothetical protein